ncbi:Disease resistance protein [Cynara cardunculus var. scolymus]|uniref:Disease resistance protein n=1 Tax=Cynara cardunculus var. scolymus TaxID=59895 RepID=A0A103XMI2_CYNCS|nr:Disease resistance protein [Cynara cardunculus var. scolymus]
MVEILVSPILQVLAEKLGSAAFKKLARYTQIHIEVKKWETSLTEIQALLNDASQKEIRDEYIKGWLNRLQHLTYDIDDILDNLATDVMHRKLIEEQLGATTSKVRMLIPTCSISFSTNIRIHDKLKDITTKLQDLEKEKVTLGLSVINGRPITMSRNYETSLPDASDIVGRQGEKEALLHKLLWEESSNQNFNIVHIVGMGGVGKTTLARLLYNGTQVQNHFKLKAWLCVSDGFDIFTISKSIFGSVTGEIKEFGNLNLVQEALRQQVIDKRFLLVLDDVWSESYEDWNTLVRPFYAGDLGSKIIITTRKEQLLKELGCDDLEHLQSLSYDDALSLFCQHALGVNNFDSHPNLRPYGEGIVKKCDGLPLGLRVLGRLLRTKTDEVEWKELLNNEIWSLQKGDGIIPALRLSYHDLSACLKRSENEMEKGGGMDTLEKYRHLSFVCEDYISDKKLKAFKGAKNLRTFLAMSTLVVFGCHDLTKLPNSFSKLTSLRHFDIRDTPLLKKMPSRISKLKNLQTLSKRRG